MESSRPNESMPLSTEQEDYLGLGRNGYGVVPVCFRVYGTLDISAIQRALSQRSPKPGRFTSQRD